jgi:LPXTG-motif cell wall-anchored protein
MVALDGDTRDGERVVCVKRPVVKFECCVTGRNLTVTVQNLNAVGSLEVRVMLDGLSEIKWVGHGTTVVFTFMKVAEGHHVINADVSLGEGKGWCRFTKPVTVHCPSPSSSPSASHAPTPTPTATAPGGGGPTATPTTPGENLPTTGMSMLWLGGGGVMAIAAGIIVLVLTRRRRIPR